MRPAEDIQRSIRNARIALDPEVKKAALKELIDELEKSKITGLAVAGPSIWRIIMESRITQLGAVAVIIIVIVMLSITVFDRTISEAYAIEQTIDAMDTINTVHFKAELYKQGTIECWMVFEDINNKPTHLSLSTPGYPIRKIDSPEGSFTYNNITNRVRKVTRDERKYNWYLDFRNFYKNALKAAKQNGSVRFDEHVDTDLQREVISINVDTGDRQCQILIDPESKLPISFNSTEPKDTSKWMHKSIAVKNMDFIGYNKAIPNNLFNIPDTAELVTEEIDVMVWPGIGLEIGDLSPEQACKTIVRETVRAWNDFNIEKVQSLYFPFILPPKQKIEEIRKASAGKTLIELVQLGKPYKQGLYWFVSSTTKEHDGKVNSELVRIRFYKFDGKRYCIIAMPD